MSCFLLEDHVRIDSAKNIYDFENGTTVQQNTITYFFKMKKRK